MSITFPRVIDSSMRAEFVNCPMRFKYAYLENLRRKASNIHLHFGGCFARGLEVFRKEFYTKGKDYSHSLASGAEAIIKAWGDFESPEGANKSLGTCLVALESYFHEYPPESDAVQPLEIADGHAIEVSFALPIPGIVHPETGEPLLYGGRFDMLARFAGSIYVNDEKTTSQLGSGWASKWRMRAQLTGYFWGARSFGYAVSGVIVRGVCILKRDITHAMVIEQRMDWEVDRWLTQLQRDVKRMIACWKEGYFDYSLDDGCISYSGCPYLTLCTTPDPTPWKETHYYTYKWDPLIREHEKEATS